MGACRMSRVLTPAIDRLLTRCVETPSGCWEFTGATDAAGYGRIGLGRRIDGTAMTHRVTYEFFVSEVPESLDLDHLCRNRACCHPWHLDPVPRAVNVSRGLRRKGYRDKTHCKQGHEYTPENTYIKRKGSGTQRACKACYRAYYQRKKESA